MRPLLLSLLVALLGAGCCCPLDLGHHDDEADRHQVCLSGCRVDYQLRSLGCPRERLDTAAYEACLAPLRADRDHCESTCAPGTPAARTP